MGGSSQQNGRSQRLSSYFWLIFDIQNKAMTFRTIALNKLGFGKPMRLSRYIARKHKSRTTVALEGEEVKGW